MVVPAYRRDHRRTGEWQAYVCHIAADEAHGPVGKPYKSENVSILKLLHSLRSNL